MTREVIVTAEVADKITELLTYLKDELKFSEEAAMAYSKRIVKFLWSLGAEVDYSLCRFRCWRELGYRCAVFERGWVIAYEILSDGVIVRDMSHGKLLTE